MMVGPLLPTTSAAAALLLVPSTGTCPLLRLRRRGRRRPSPRRLNLVLCLCSSASCSSSSSSSYNFNGWGELPADFSFPFLLLFLPDEDEQQRQKKRNGLLFLLLLLLVISLSRRLPPLPLLAASFTAGFATRHLSSPQPAADLTPVLADVDAQVRALRDRLAASRTQPPPLLDAVDRLADAVLHATRLARRDSALAPILLGDLADSLAAWARDTMRDLTSSRNKALHSKPIQQDPPAAQQSEPKKLEEEEEEESNPKLEKLLLKHRRRQSSLLEKRTLEIREDTLSYRLNIDCETHRHVTEEQAERHPFVAAGLLDHPLYHDDDAAGATNPDCQEGEEEEFNHNVKEAADILNRARECMRAGADEETADALLYKSASLLSAALALRPTSLVAVGQLGNTYLLHGELKLKISRELRTLLANTGALLTGTRHRSRKVDTTRMLSRDNISAALVDVCEECESLLIEAGRSYRTALSIDSGDVKALYNWGLALIFRAQLLADIGPEVAVDADRLYLAAIDKFDAMLSKSNIYAPEALYRWGTALQQRSHLRPRNNREKIRLLEQAKSLFEDVLYVEADNKMVREALSSCISELNYHGRWI